VRFDRRKAAPLPTLLDLHLNSYVYRLFYDRYARAAETGCRGTGRDHETPPCSARNILTANNCDELVLPQQFCANKTSNVLNCIGSDG
jgi:hypothetical protein